MKQTIRGSLLFFYKILDVSGLAFSLWLAFLYAAPQGTDYIYRAVFEPNFESTLFFIGVLLSWGFCLSSLWIYRSKRLASLNDEFFDVFRAVIFCTLILATLILFAEWQIFPKRFLLQFAVTATFILFLIRLIKRRLLQQFRIHGRNLRSVIIAGSGRRGQKVFQLINQHPELGYFFIGFVDDLETSEVLGKISQIQEILARNVVDEIIICLPIKSFYEQMEYIAQVAEEQGVMVRINSDLFNMRLARAVSETIDEVPMLSLHTGPNADWRMLLKNVFDFVGTLFLLILLAPVFLLIAILIKLDSKGPIFFIQERIGLNKRIFRIFKFRTMCIDAEEKIKDLEASNEAGGPVFKMKNDPRVTNIGKFLRKTSLDELPQLFNVLTGELSLVGPRPLPIRDYKNFDEYRFNRRFSIKPGITCIWQISGRSETTFDKWIMQDLEYIDKWSLLLDFKILLKTIPAVLRGTGAM